MKNEKIKLALMLLLGMTWISTSNAQTVYSGNPQSGGGATYVNGDLIVGFTTTSGNDAEYDLGAASLLVNGETWNLSGLLNPIYGGDSAVYWGVVGTITSGHLSYLTYDDQDYGTLAAVPTQGAWNAINTAVKTIVNNSFSADAKGSAATIPASSQASWDSETLNPTLGTQYVNENVNPNNFTAGEGTIDFWQQTDNGANPTQLGTFSLSGNVLTFNTMATGPSVTSVVGSVTNGFAPLTVVFTNTTTGSVTNWVWSFGDGNSITNTTGANVTNTYAFSGVYSVSLTVYGQGGTSELTLNNYITVSPGKPKISSFAFSGGHFVFSGSNCPAGAPYHIISATNLLAPAANWVTVYSSTFGSSGTFSVTNSTTNAASFFKLVSP